MLNKLRLKFMAVNLGIVTAMLVVIFAMVYNSTQQQLNVQADTAMQLLKQESATGGRRDVSLPYFTIQVNVFGEALISGTSHLDLTDTELMRDLLKLVKDSGLREGKIPAYALRFARVTVIGAEKFIFLDLSGQQAALESLMDSTLLAGALGLLAFAVISWFLAKWAVKPVEVAWRKQQQFVSDASHELKTPLTVIISNAELLSAQEGSPETQQRLTGNILSASTQMRGLTEGLLELSRADNGQVKKHFEKLDLSELVEEAVLPFEPVFFERGLELRSAVEPGIRLTGNSRYLKQVVDILLDNACKYATGGIVDLELRRVGRNCQLTVANAGTPIAKEELEKIFERFYRADSARADSGSYGLGLAIAKSVVQDHGGRIWAQSNESGNCFFVRFPCDTL